MESALNELGIDFNSSYIGGVPTSQPSLRAAAAKASTSWLDDCQPSPAACDVEGTLSPIKPEEVPNSGLMTAFADDTWGHFKDADGNWLAIPFSFAPLGITDQTKISPTSYQDLLDPELVKDSSVSGRTTAAPSGCAAALGYKAEEARPNKRRPPI
ncbi:MAG: hypothetical protein R2706_13920 [Acidimicrobiales bacterium]